MSSWHSAYRVATHAPPGVALRNGVSVWEKAAFRRMTE